MKALFVSLIFLVSPLTLLAENITVRISGMVCDSCAQGLKETFEKLPEVSQATGDFEKKTLLIQTKEKMKLDDESIKKEIIKAGYTPLSIARETTPAK